MVAPVYDSSSPEAEADRVIPGQPGLHSKTRENTRSHLESLHILRSHGPHIPHSMTFERNSKARENIVSRVLLGLVLPKPAMRRLLAPRSHVDTLS